MSTAARIAALSLTAATALALTACGGTDSEPTSAVPTLTQTTTSTATTAPTTESETSPETTLPDQAALTEVDAERFLHPDTYGYMVTFAEGTTCTVWESDSGGNPTVDCDFPFPDNVLVEAEIPPMATHPNNMAVANTIRFQPSTGFVPRALYQENMPGQSTTGAVLNPDETVTILGVAFEHLGKSTVTGSHGEHAFRIEDGQFSSTSWSAVGTASEGTEASGGELDPEDFRVSPTAFTVISADDRVNCLINTADSGNGIYCATLFDPPLSGTSELTGQEEQFNSFHLDDDGTFRPFHASSSLSLTDGKRLRPGESVTIHGTRFSQLDDVTFETVNGDARATVADGAFTTGAR